uniref:Uncharacterized protein n=1 Tax=Arundo donax TaxID=35708 RepID=A0A0A9H7L1_ARUDO
MALQSHARAAAEQQQSAVVGVARSLRRRALVRVLLGADSVRAVEPRVSPRLTGPALAKMQGRAASWGGHICVYSRPNC